MALALSTTFPTKSSKIFSSTRSLELAVHLSPLKEKIWKTTASRALSKSASAKTRAGLLPPSSGERRLRWSAALRMTIFPVSVSPVRVRRGTRGWATKAAPASSPKPWTRLKTPGEVRLL